MRRFVAAVLFAICLAPGAASAQGAGPLASNEPFTFTLRPSRIIVRIPDTSLRPSADPNGRPNYFKVEGRNPLLIVSGWIEPDVGYKGLDAFWKGESASPAFAPPFAPIRVEMLHEGRWEIVAYDVQLPGGGTQANLRAERVQSGTWIDLHLSTASGQAPETLRGELLTALRRIEVWDKVVTRAPAGGQP